MTKKAGRPFDLDRFEKSIDLLVSLDIDSDKIAAAAHLSRREKEFIWQMLEQDPPNAAEIAAKVGVARQAADLQLDMGL